MKAGDIILGLLVDSAEFKKTVTKAATEAGDAAGKTLSSRIGTGLKVGAAVIGAGLAIAFKGVVELDTATAKFRAETGATAEEAKRAGQAIADMSRGNLQNIAQIGEVLTKVHTDLGLTGDAAEETTRQFLKFATATGQDAVAAVTDMDDILDAYGLTADKIPGIMDQLVASHQRFGGSIEANQQALGKMAPQLTAMGLSLDDGIGLLNLFAESGLDAEKAQLALNAAVKNLPPGTSFEDIVTELSSIEDPAKRAQRAIEIFGAKAGVGLANAIKPGMTSMDDLIITADEAAGATKDAADAIEGSFGNRIQLLLNNFKGALAGVTAEFGPLFTGFGSLAMMAPALSKMFGGLAGHLGITTAVGNAGTAWGKIAGSRFGLAFKLAAVAGIAALAAELDQPISDIGRDAGRKLFGAIGDEAKGLASGTVFDSVTDGLHELWFQIGQNDPLKGAIGKAIERLTHDAMAQGIDPAPLVVAFREFLAQGMDPAAAEAAARAAGTAVGPAFAEGLAASSGTLAERTASFWERVGVVGATATATGYGEGIAAQRNAMANVTDQTLKAAATDAAARAWPSFRELGRGIPGAIGRGMQDAANILRDGAAVLRDILENGTSPRERAMEAIGAEYIKLVRRGMDSERDGAITTARELAIGAINTIEDAGLKGTKGQKGLKAIGIYFDELLASGLTGPQALAALDAAGVDASSEALSGVRSKYPQFFTAGRDMSKETADGVNDVDLFDEGAAIASSLARGLRSRMDAVRRAASDLSDILVQHGYLESPAKEGPWSKNGGPFAWFFNAGSGSGKMLAAGLRGGVGEVARSSAMLARAASLGLVAPSLGLAAPGLGDVGMGSLAGSYAVSGTQTFRHQIGLDAEAVRLLRAAGYDDEAVGRAIGRWIGGESAGSGLRWSPG